MRDGYYVVTYADKLWLYLKDKGYEVIKAHYKPSMRVELSVRHNDKLILLVNVMPDNTVTTKSAKYLKDESVRERDRVRRLVQEFKKKAV